MRYTVHIASEAKSSIRTMPAGSGRLCLRLTAGSPVHAARRAGRTLADWQLGGPCSLWLGSELCWPLPVPTTCLAPCQFATGSEVGTGSLGPPARVVVMQRKSIAMVCGQGCRSPHCEGFCHRRQVRAHLPNTLRFHGASWRCSMLAMAAQHVWLCHQCRGGVALVTTLALLARGALAWALAQVKKASQVVPPSQMRKRSQPADWGVAARSSA